MRFIRKPLLCAASFFLFAAAISAQTDWRTPAEISDYRTTPDYAATVAYLERVAAAAPNQVRIENFGKTGEGRDLKIVIVSKDGVFDPAAIHASGRVVLLVQNSIHAGEMDGKDSCLALLRELVITKSKAALLDKVVLVFIPVYNLDGHERRSAYNRINQNGPEEMGFRANSTNLNLNRDYMKADTPEARAFLKLFHRWLPDFFVDDHVTDGADFQYDVTFLIDDGPNVAPPIADWAKQIAPEIADAVNKTGHMAFPSYIELMDETDPTRGLGFYFDPPRFSTGQMVLENRPGMLVELHMLKDYKTRVTGNYELLAALMAVLNRDAEKLIAINHDADAAAAKLTGEKLPLAIDWNGESTPVLFHGFKYTRQLSEVSGALWISYSHEPQDFTLLSATGTKITSSVIPPAGYVIPQQWTQVLDVLSAHDVHLQRTTEPWTGKVERYQCNGMQWQARPFEGHHTLFGGEGERGAGAPHFGHCVIVNETVTVPAGSYIVPLNQRLSKVAINWLEPEAPDSALRWGFFDTIFEQKEYGEGYVLEKLAREMLANDPAIKAEFEHRVMSDPKFAGNPDARLAFFYEHSPWYKANRVGEYPVLRLSSLEGIKSE
jgi:murein tripeptide amidase MpaA